MEALVCCVVADISSADAAVSSAYSAMSLVSWLMPPSSSVIRPTAPSISSSALRARSEASVPAWVRLAASRTSSTASLVSAWMPAMIPPASAADWAARSAFERASALERVADLIESRRDDLARTLTLDQGKPLHAEAYGEVDELVVYWRMAAADATRLHGSMPPSVDAGKRILAYRVPRGVVGVITPWNWPYTMPAELIAPALGFLELLGGVADEFKGARRRLRVPERRR